MSGPEVIADIARAARKPQMRCLIVLAALVATPASAADAAFCTALEGLRSEAIASRTPQRVAVFRLEEMMFACGKTRTIQAQVEFCSAAFGAVGIEFTHDFPWEVYDCLKSQQITPQLVLVDQYTGIRKRKKISRLSAGWKDGTRIDIRFEPTGNFSDQPKFKDYWGAYMVVVWSP